MSYIEVVADTRELAIIAVSAQLPFGVVVALGVFVGITVDLKRVSLGFPSFLVIGRFDICCGLVIDLESVSLAGFVVCVALAIFHKGDSGVVFSPLIGGYVNNGSLAKWLRVEYQFGLAEALKVYFCSLIWLTTSSIMAVNAVEMISTEVVSDASWLFIALRSSSTSVSAAVSI